MDEGASLPSPSLQPSPKFLIQLTNTYISRRCHHSTCHLSGYHCYFFFIYNNNDSIRKRNTYSDE
jgi:hypothetical protein